MTSVIQRISIGLWMQAFWLVQPAYFDRTLDAINQLRFIHVSIRKQRHAVKLYPVARVADVFRRLPGRRANVVSE